MGTAKFTKGQLDEVRIWAPPAPRRNCRSG